MTKNTSDEKNLVFPIYPLHTCPNPFPVREMLNIHTDRCEQGVNIYVYELIKTK